MKLVKYYNLNDVNYWQYDLRNGQAYVSKGFFEKNYRVAIHKKNNQIQLTNISQKELQKILQQ